MESDRRRCLGLGFAGSVCLLLAGALIAGCGSPQIGAKPGTAFRILQEASSVEWPYLGFEGEPSCHVMAYQRLLQSPGAVERFEHLFGSAKYPAGRLYALAGLYSLDAERFRAALTRFLEGDNAWTLEEGGCELIEVTTFELAEEIRTGYWPMRWDYDRPGPDPIPISRALRDCYRRSAVE